MNNIGISINVFTPLVMGGDFLRSITDIQSNYQHLISAFGGYDSASFNVNCNTVDLEDWLENGLARHIVVYDESQNVIWEGFVNKITINYGALSITRGPLMDVANRVKLVYSTIDTTINPPAIGSRTTTAATDSPYSQGKYGIFQATLSSGGVTQAGATQIRNSYLAEHKYPATTTNINLTNGSQPSVNVECVGYVNMLNVYEYNNANTGTQNASAKITAVLAANINPSTIPFNATNVTTNTLQVPVNENSDDKALNVIKSVVAFGDSSDNRWLFGIYSGRRAYYNVAPTEISYYQRITSRETVTETPTGAKVFPWNVLPGRWCFVPDFLVGKSQPTDKRLDPRYIFIESVTYTAPYGLVITGGSVEKLPQKLAKYGLAGVSA